MAKDSTPTPRAKKVIRTNVKVPDDSALLVVKSSIYPWADLIPKGDAEPTGNFFVEAEDEAAARLAKSSINSSGLNYYLKRKLRLIPVIVPSLINGTYGCVCTAIRDRSQEVGHTGPGVGGSWGKFRPNSEGSIPSPVYMKVRGAFSNVMFTYIVDECTPTRHFFARLRLCKHKTRTEKMTMNQSLMKIWNEHYDPGKFKRFVTFHKEV